MCWCFVNCVVQRSIILLLVFVFRSSESTSNTIFGGLAVFFLFYIFFVFSLSAFSQFHGFQHVFRFLNIFDLLVDAYSFVANAQHPTQNVSLIAWAGGLAAPMALYSNLDRSHWRVGCGLVVSVCFLALLFSFLFISGREAHLINVVKKANAKFDNWHFCTSYKLVFRNNSQEPTFFFSKKQNRWSTKT